MDNDLLEEFKARYLRALGESDPRLPIVSSIGKQSKGKSYFLGILFNDNSIPNKQGKLGKRGTNCLYHKVYDNFLLLDMEGVEGDQGIIERDILNFSTTFTLTDILLLHISQEDLENSVVLENFSYAFWHSSKIVLNFKINMPDIILLIRDPRNTEESEEVIQFYKELVSEFASKVNARVKKLEEDFIRSIQSKLIDQNTSIEDKNKMAREIDILNQDMNLTKFEIHSHFCIIINKDSKDRATSIS